MLTRGADVGGCRNAISLVCERLRLHDTRLHLSVHGDDSAILGIARRPGSGETIARHSHQLPAAGPLIHGSE